MLAMLPAASLTAVKSALNDAPISFNAALNCAFAASIPSVNNVFIDINMWPNAFALLITLSIA